MMLTDLTTTGTSSAASSTVSLPDLSCFGQVGPHPPPPTVPELSHQLAKYWHLYHLSTSPYYEETPYGTILAKSAQFCDRINALSDELDKPQRVQLLVRLFVQHILPITRIKGTSIDYLRFSSWCAVPNDPQILVENYVLPLYNERLELIRKEISGHRIFLSFTLEEFIHGDEKNFGKVYGEDRDFLDYLFVIVGVYGNEDDVEGQGVGKVKKTFVLKVVRLLEGVDDSMDDDVFKKIVIDSVQLLWPNQDHFSQSSHQLVHLISEPFLDLSSTVADLRLTHPSAFGRLAHLSYSYDTLNRIELSLRASHQTVVHVIEAIRMQWNKSGAFRDKYITFNNVSNEESEQQKVLPANLEPPESFYDAAAFYRDHFTDVQVGVLKWRSPRFIEVRRAFSDPEFREQLDEFAQHESLLGALAATNRAWCDRSHEFSHRIGLLVEQVNNVDLSIPIEQECAIEGVNDGLYKLLHQLVSRSLPAESRSIVSSEVVKQCLMDSLANGILDGGQVADGGQQTDGREWVPPLNLSQMYRTFPRFMHMFGKSSNPLVWKYMDQCALVYCYAETDK